VREAVRPEVAEMALVASFLAPEGLALTHDANILFVEPLCIVNGRLRRTMLIRLGPGCY